MILNDAGLHTKNCWFEIPEHFPNTKLHEFIVMPNHIHGIIEIVTDTNVGTNDNSPTTINANISRANNDSPQRSKKENTDSPQFKSPSKTIGSIIRGFKIGITKWFRINMEKQFPVGIRVLQRDYFEHIIRDDQSHQRIANYILENPKNWENDKFH